MLDDEDTGSTDPFITNPMTPDSHQYALFLTDQPDSDQKYTLFPSTRLSIRENLLCWIQLIENRFSGACLPAVTFLYDNGQTSRIHILSVLAMTEKFDAFLAQSAETKENNSDFLIPLYGDDPQTARTYFRQVLRGECTEGSCEQTDFRRKYELRSELDLCVGSPYDLDWSLPDEPVTIPEERFDDSKSLSFWEGRWYQRRSRYNGGCYYHCYSKTCNGSVFVRSGVATVIKKHVADCFPCECIDGPRQGWVEFVRQLQEQAKDVSKSPAQILGDMLSQEEFYDFLTMIKYTILEGLILQYRPLTGILGESPLNCIPDNDFVFFYSGGEHGMMLLGSDWSRERARQADWLLIDGTFKVCPLPYYQYLTIMGEDIQTGQFFPICGALLPDKKQETYAQALDTISIFVDFPAVQHITCDFERGLIEQVTLWLSRQRMESATFTGCRFHYCQCLKKRILKIYGRNPPAVVRVIFKIFMDMIVCDLDTVQWILDEFSGRDKKLDDFVDYFDRTWIPRFYDWNLASQTKEKRRKSTNNGLESYHSSLLYYLGPHSRIERFVSTVKEMSEIKQQLIEKNIQRIEMDEHLPVARDVIENVHSVLASLPAKRDGAAV